VLVKGKQGPPRPLCAFEGKGKGCKEKLVWNTLFWVVPVCRYRNIAKKGRMKKYLNLSTCQVEKRREVKILCFHLVPKNFDSGACYNKIHITVYSSIGVKKEGTNAKAGERKK